MGIHPPGEPDDSSWIPSSVDEAAEFYRAYAARRFKPAGVNPQGVQLTKENLEMLAGLVGPVFSWFLGGRMVAPSVYSRLLLRPDAIARLRVPDVQGHEGKKAWLIRFPVRWTRFWRFLDGMGLGWWHERVAAKLFRGIVARYWGKRQPFVPALTISDLPNFVTPNRWQGVETPAVMTARGFLESEEPLDAPHDALDADDLAKLVDKLHAEKQFGLADMLMARFGALVGASLKPPV
jgi:hypothetical protein